MFQKLKFKEANDKQLEAIKSIDGPLLIVAGPGTGKTYTLINRALNLIVNYGVSPSSILFATFTEKAANELITRLSVELAKYNIDFNPEDMYIGTFHSICLKIIKDNVSLSTLKKNFKLYDQFDQQYFIYRHFGDFKSIPQFDFYFKNGSYWDKCASIMKLLNRLTEELIDYNDLLNSGKSNLIFYGNVMRKYEELRNEGNFVDFSSLQVEAYKLLKENKQLFDAIQDKVKYLMIDEYQDTNHIQEKLTMLLGQKHSNICVVGDDDQAIYRFRGATVRNILEFPKSFENCKKVELTYNYRSNSDIVNFYNKWMDTTEGREFKFDWGKYRYGKTIIPYKKNTTSETSVMRIETKEDGYINQKTLDFIRELLRSGSISNLNQIAFLFRSVKNEHVKELADYLDKNGIPVYSPRSNMFFERNETKGLIGILILMFPKYLTNDMQTLRGGFKNPMSDYYKDCLETAKEIMEGNPDLFTWVRFRIGDHVNPNLKSLDYGFAALTYQLFQFEPFLSEMNIDLKTGANDTRTIRNIGKFINLLTKFEGLNNLSVLTKANMDQMCYRLFNVFIRFLYDGGISEYEDDSEYAPSGCVSFMTIHQSKGMEFPVVIVGSQSSTPKKQYDEEIEAVVEDFSGRGMFEELEDIKYFDFWRLFYVAFSRAQSLLVTLADASKANEPSKYFEWYYDELPFEVDYSKFKFESIKSGNLKNSYSFTSDINVYMICPTQYKYFKELGFDPVRVSYTLFGTIVHETIEDVHKAVLKGNVSEVTDENIAKWLYINYKTASKAHNSFLAKHILDAALVQVKNYVEKASENWKSISNAEMPITLAEDKFIITGKVDLVTNEKGEYQILDFKTEKKPDVNKETDKIERVRRQLEVYAYLFEKRYGIKIKGMKAYYTGETDGMPTISFTRDERHIKNTISTFTEVVDKIERKDFSSRCCDMNICKNCDLRHYCKKG